MIFKKASSGFDITRQCWELLRMDPELMAFPLFSMAAGAAILATTFGAVSLIPELGQRLYEPDSLSQRALTIVALFGVYYLEYFVMLFFNTALVGCALIRFSGGDPTIKDGFRIAFSRLPQIAAWTIIAAAVDTLLSELEDRFGWFGKIVIELTGASWTMATFFVVPVLVVDGAGPTTAVQRSLKLLKQTWGEAIAGNFVIQVVSWAVVIPFFGVCLAGIYLAVWLESLAILAAAATVMGSGLIVLLVVTSALHQIFLAGLYRYATTGDVPQGFSEASFRGALKNDPAPANPHISSVSAGGLSGAYLRRPLRSASFCPECGFTDAPSVRACPKCDRKTIQMVPRG